MTAEALRQKIKLVPAPIQDWFWSDELVDRILALKDQFKLYGNRWGIVGDLLVRLETKDLAWENFKVELIKQLGISPIEGEKLYDEIKLQLLMPIARDLAAYGIGTKEFAVIGAAAPAPVGIPAPAAPPAGSAGPLPVSTTLPSFFSSPSQVKPFAPPPNIQQAPPPVPAAPNTPAPVFLHQETQTAPAQPVFNMPLDLGNRKGNQFTNAGASTAAPPRPARVELGKQLPQYDGAGPLPVRTQKETPLPRPVDYSTLISPDASRLTIATPEISPSGDISFGMQGASNLPPMESVQIPVATTPLPDIAATENRGGFVDNILRKIAPWHYERFTAGGKASQVLEVAQPGKTVNYAEVPPKPSMTLGASADMPMPTPISLPSQQADVPEPPKPLT